MEVDVSLILSAIKYSKLVAVVLKVVLVVVEVLLVVVTTFTPTVVLIICL